MQVTPYLMLDGRCEEALEFYKKAVGAEIGMLMRFKEAPEGACAPGAGDKVMHSSFNRRHPADGVGRQQRRQA